MKTYLERIRERFQKELSKNSVDYLKSGLLLFHNRSQYGIQVIIGNLSIAIELMLKAVIAKQNPYLLFKGLPIELKVLFTCPEIKTRASSWRRFDIDLRSSAFDTIGLDECISVFHIMHPEHKHLLQPYFKLLSSCRNVSLHGTMPSFQIYDLERSVYLALNLHNILRELDVFGIYRYYPTKEDKSFLESFDLERVERVRKRIEEAKRKSKDLKHESSSLLVEGWEVYTTSCPICESDGLLGGYTDPWIEATEDHVEDSGLMFYAESFKCEKCGLTLDDPKELALAGMEDSYDRSSESDKYYEGYEPDVDDLDYEK